jgi:hypothetical protein
MLILSEIEGANNVFAETCRKKIEKAVALLSF